MTSEQPSENTENSEKSSSSAFIFVAVVVLIVAVFAFLFLQDDNHEVNTDKPEPIAEPVIIEQDQEPQVVAVEPENFEPIEPVVEEAEPEPTLPELDKSDDFIFDQISALSWRKELTSLILTDDLVRRIVVFTDNFATGDMAYSHLPLKTPNGHFSAVKISTEGEDVYRFTEANVVRYQQYIELLNSFEPEALVSTFMEVKPLFDQAYSELGYSDKSFTEALQQSIDKVLGFQAPVDAPKLLRPSVIFKYQDQNLEELPETDKFLMRLGNENLLQLKAIALALNKQFETNQ